MINLIKIIAAAITVVFAFVVAIIEIRKDPGFWLNRFFGAFYILVGLGFFLYTIYHFILGNPGIIIPIQVASHICYNISLSLLLMTVFIIEYSERVAMKKEFIALLCGLFIFSIFGYFVGGLPSLEMEKYAEGIVTTSTPSWWLLTMNLYRLVILLFVTTKFYILSKKAEEPKLKSKLRLFFTGQVIITVAIVLNLGGGLISGIGDYLKIAGLLLVNVGAAFTLKGFLK